MIITVILVLAGFLSMAAMLFFARDHGQPPADLANLRKQMQSLDIEAFRNLIDDQDEEFLRRTLEGPQFRSIQRDRLLAAVEYIASAARNATILQRFGEAARRSPSPSVAQAGDKLVNSAIRFRINALHSIVRLYVAILVPGASVHRLRIAEGYERLTALVVLLGCLHFETRGAYAPTATRRLTG